MAQYTTRFSQCSNMPRQLEFSWYVIVAVASQSYHNIIIAACMDAYHLLISISGNATRFCSSDSNWGEVNVLNCTSQEFVQLEQMLVSINGYNLIYYYAIHLPFMLIG